MTGRTERMAFSWRPRALRGLLRCIMREPKKPVWPKQVEVVATKAGFDGMRRYDEGDRFQFALHEGQSLPTWVIPYVEVLTPLEILRRRDEALHADLYARRRKAAELREAEQAAEAHQYLQRQLREAAHAERRAQRRKPAEADFYAQRSRRGDQ